MSDFRVSNTTKKVWVRVRELDAAVSCAVDDYLYILDQLKGNYDTQDVARIARRLRQRAEVVQGLIGAAEQEAEYSGEVAADKTVQFVRFWGETTWQMYGEARKAIVAAEAAKLDLDRSEG